MSEDSNNTKNFHDVCARTLDAVQTHINVRDRTQNRKGTSELVLKRIKSAAEALERLVPGQSGYLDIAKILQKSIDGRESCITSVSMNDYENVTFLGSLNADQDLGKILLDHFRRRTDVTHRVAHWSEGGFVYRQRDIMQPAGDYSHDVVERLEHLCQIGDWVTMTTAGKEHCHEFTFWPSPIQKKEPRLSRTEEEHVLNGLIRPTEVTIARLGIEWPLKFFDEAYEKNAGLICAPTHLWDSATGRLQPHIFNWQASRDLDFIDPRGMNAGLLRLTNRLGLQKGIPPVQNENVCMIDGIACTVAQPPGTRHHLVWTEFRHSGRAKLEKMIGQLRYDASITRPPMMPRYPHRKLHSQTLSVGAIRSATRRNRILRLVHEEGYCLEFNNGGTLIGYIKPLQFLSRQPQGVAYITNLLQNSSEIAQSLDEGELFLVVYKGAAIGFLDLQI